MEVIKSSNYVLERLLKEFNDRGTKIKLEYSKENYLTIKGEGFDYEELCFFLIGILMTAYENLKPNIVFNLAMIEALTKLKNQCKLDIGECLNEEDGEN